MKFTVGLLALTVGCGSIEPKPDTAPSTTPAPSATPAAARGPASVGFVATYERIWAALPRAYKAVGLTVNAADTSTRSMGFAGTIRREIGGTRLSKFFHCGSSIGDNADTYDIQLFVASQVGKNQSGRIQVTTGLRVSAKSAFGGNLTLCTTSGELERRINAALNAEMRR